jgi:hypothetical protein
VDTIAIESDCHVQNGLKECKKDLDCYYKKDEETTPEFQFEMFGCRFNNSFDTEIRISKSDTENLGKAIAEADHQFPRVENFDSKNCAVRWEEAAEKTLKVIG